MWNGVGTSIPAYREFCLIVRRLIPGKRDRVIIKITPPYPSNQRKVDAFFIDLNGMPETIVPVDKRVSIEAIYTLLSSSFILFCPID
jgi:hypothetical protein